MAIIDLNTTNLPSDILSNNFERLRCGWLIDFNEPANDALEASSLDSSMRSGVIIIITRKYSYPVCGVSGLQ